MNNKSYKFLINILVATVLLASLNACSLFGGGKKKGVEGDGTLSESDLDKERFGSGNIPFAEGEGMFKDVLFGYDSTSISDSGRQAIEFNAQVLQSNANLSITLEGHCDERGTNEYNLALGAERAKAVMEVLTSYGIERSRLNSISYGEELPVDSGTGESAWARNRRVHFGQGGAKN